MKGKRRAILSSLGLVVLVPLAICNRRTADDRIGQVCVAPAPTGLPEPRLDADAEVYVYVSLRGKGSECLSSGSFSRVPKIEPVTPTRWRVTGGFVDANSDRPLTPDCNGGLSMATLGHLATGTYEVESTLGSLRFDIPSPEPQICVSRP